MGVLVFFQDSVLYLFCVFCVLCGLSWCAFCGLLVRSTGVPLPATRVGGNYERGPVRRLPAATNLQIRSRRRESADTNSRAIGGGA
jgi:hypothetical protein